MNEPAGRVPGVAGRTSPETKARPEARREEKGLLDGLWKVESRLDQPAQNPSLSASERLEWLEAERRRLIGEIEALEGQVGELNRWAHLGLLVSGVSHEINNLLTGAIGFTYLLGRHVGQSEGPERKMLSSVSTELHRCAALTRGVVQYARSIRPQREVVPLETLVQRAATAVRPQFEAHGISLQVNLKEQDLKVLGVPSQLETTARNLLLSALDRTLAASPGETGTAGGPSGAGRERSVWLRMERDGNTVLLEVVDSSGGGEPPSVWEPLMNAVPGQAPFGLLIAKAVVKEHGGKMEMARNETGLVCGLRFPRFQE